MGNRPGAGRPRKWTDPKKMQKAIDEYFVECECELMRNDGKILVDKYGKPIYLNRKPPTISGLACYLGFKDRQSLLDYQKNDEFSCTILRAKLRIEAYLEERPMDRGGQRGAEFNLRCNYGWNDKQKDDNQTEDNNNLGVIMLAPVKTEEGVQKENDNTI